MRYAIHHQVDQLLLEQGRFSPIAWLLANGYLDYADYINWRDGVIGTLETCFNIPREQIVEQLHNAMHYARSLGLEEISGAYFSTERNELTISRNTGDDLLYKTEFEPARHRLQMDIFFDSAPIYAETELIEAIVARNTRKIPEQLDSLRIYDYDACENYQRLIEYDKKFNSHVLSVQQKLAVLDEELMPLAMRLLRGEALHYLTPLWKNLSADLAGQPFDQGNPKLHASYAAIKAFDWPDVIAAIDRENNRLEQPILLFRYAEACFKTNKEVAGLEYWFQLFLLHDEHAEQLIRQTGHSLLRDDWLRFLELDPELAAQFFPAWLLLIKPALAKHEFQLDGTSEGHRAFNLLKRLNSDDPESNSITLRSELQNLNPGLFRHFMASR
jgi:hypothetical protein